MARNNFMKGMLDAAGGMIQAKADAENAKNNFMASMLTMGIKNKLEGEQKKEGLNLEVTADRLKKQNMTPLEQENLSQYRTNPSAWDISGGKPKPIDIQERLTNKVATGGLESLNPNEKYLWGLMEKKMGGASTGGLSPQMQRLKAIDTKNLLDTMKTNEVKKGLINEVSGIIDKIPQGKMGSLQLGAMNWTDPTNPIFEKVQKVRMVLTDAQLLNTAKTKGAISDKEMELFSNAAANNDFASPKIKPVLKKLVDFMNADEEASKEAYLRNYGEDPNEWFRSQKMNETQSTQGGSPTQGRVAQPSSGDIRAQYNALRAQGLSAAQVRAQLGL